MMTNAPGSTRVWEADEELTEIRAWAYCSARASQLNLLIE